LRASRLQPGLCHNNGEFPISRRCRMAALVFVCFILSVSIAACSFSESLPTLDKAISGAGEYPLLQMVAENIDSDLGISDNLETDAQEIGSSQDLFFAIQDALDTYESELYIEIESIDLFQTYWDELINQAAIHSVYLRGPIELEYRNTSPCVIRMMYAYDDAGEILQKFVHNEPMEFDRESTGMLWNSSQQVLEEIIRENMTDLEKEIAIHDYIVSRTSYATTGDQASLSLAQSVLINGEGQCQGYAETMGLLLTLSGIPSRVISGYASNLSEVPEAHAWNQVYLDGSWYHVDATWNDPVPDMKDYVSHTYLNRSDAFMRLDHTWSDYYYVCPYDYEDISVNP